MLSLAAVALALALTMPLAQAEDLNIRVGQVVWVGRTGGDTVHGRVEVITLDAVTVANAQRTTIPRTAIIQIRIRDRLWEGAISGAAIGATAGFFAPGRCDDGDCIAGPIILYGAIGAGIGALLDSLTSRKIVYPPRRPRRQRVTVVPIIGPARAGLAFVAR